MLYLTIKGALFSKFDLSDANKCIPAAVNDLCRQGFPVARKIFVENQMVFGAVPCV